MGYVSDNINLLSDIAKCIAMQFGENCEVVLHDLTLPYNKTIVAIWNGHVTGRKVGDGGTNAGLEISIPFQTEKFCALPASISGMSTEKSMEVSVSILTLRT